MAESPRKEYQFSLTSVPSAGDKELRTNLIGQTVFAFQLTFVTTRFHCSYQVVYL